MIRARMGLDDLFRQLDLSDAHARLDDPGAVPSAWRIQNGHLRDRARDVLAALATDGVREPLGGGK